MKALRVISLLLCFLLSTTASNATAVSTNAPAGKPPLQIVTCRKGVDMEGLIHEHGLAPKYRYRHFNGFAAPMPEALIQKLKADPRVMFVEADGQVAPCGQTNQQVIGWGLRRMAFDHFPPAHINGTQKSLDVDVAVLDSGIDPHTDLPPSYYWFSPWSDNPRDDLNHGTAVAGVIAALDNNFGVVGVAPGVRIWNFKVAGPPPENNWTDVVVGMDDVIQHADRISVANMSFTSLSGGSPTATINGMLQLMVEAGIVVVAAAGNSAKDIAGPDGVFGTVDDALPAASPWAMAVSAMDPSNGIDPAFNPEAAVPKDVFWSDSPTLGSNFNQAERTNSNYPPYGQYMTNYVSSLGGAIDVAAPGVSIATTAGNGTNAPETRGTWYSSVTGTSMAAPHVTGLVALYIATHGRATNAAGVFAIRQAIINAALPQSQWRPHGQPFNALTNNTGDPDTHPEPLAIASESLLAPPVITKTAGAAGNYSVQFAAVPGYDYTVQSASDLTPPISWANLAGRTGTNFVATVSVTDSNVASRSFYRLARKGFSEAPLIVSQPPSLKRPVGADASFHARIGGVAPLGCYWQKDGALPAVIADVDGPSDKVTLTLTNVQPADAGGYALVVTNAYGSVTSAVATLTILTNWTSVSVTGVLATATSFLGPPYNAYASNAVDGVYNTVWQSDGANVDPNPAITFDLGAVRAVESVQIWNAAANAVRRMVVETSSDGVGYTSLGQFTLTTYTPASETISLGGVVLRHVRLSIIENWSGEQPRFGDQPGYVAIAEAKFQEYLGD